LKSNALQKFHIPRGSGSLSFHLEGVTVNLNSTALQCSSTISAASLAAIFCVPFLLSLNFKLDDSSTLKLVNALSFANNEGTPSKKLWDYEKLASACTGKCTGACQNTDSELISECSGSCSSQCDSNNISMFASACRGKCSGACATSQ
uniref:Uncharacterized protein n=1 Tax=Romanomermis culicivorax TaxID=13658 RepID=A0A915KXP3_ROMCU